MALAGSGRSTLWRETFIIIVVIIIIPPSFSSSLPSLSLIFTSSSTLTSLSLISSLSSPSSSLSSSLPSSPSSSSSSLQEVDVAPYLDDTLAARWLQAKCPQWAHPAPAGHMTGFSFWLCRGTCNHQFHLTVQMVCSCSSSSDSLWNAGAPCSISTKMHPAPLFRYREVLSWDDRTGMDRRP